MVPKIAALSTADQAGLDGRFGERAAHRAALGLISVPHRCHQACHMPKRTCLDPCLSFKSPGAVQCRHRGRACSHAGWIPAQCAHLNFPGRALACILCPLPALSRDNTSHDSRAWESEPDFFGHLYHQRPKFMLNTFWGGGAFSFSSSVFI